MRRYQIYSDCGLPRKYWNSKPRDLPEPFYEKYKKLWAKMSDAGDRSAKVGCLFLAGKIGTETYDTARLFASIFCKAFLVSNMDFEWVDYYKIPETCKSDIRYSDSDSMANRFEKVDCLVVDGFGISNYWSKTEFEYWFMRILFSRQKNEKPTIIITTIMPSDVKTFYSEPFYQLIRAIKPAVDFTSGGMGNVSIG